MDNNSKKLDGLGNFMNTPSQIYKPSKDPLALGHLSNRNYSLGGEEPNKHTFNSHSKPSIMERAKQLEKQQTK